MKKLNVVCVLLLALFMLAGCGDKNEALPIHEDTDVCALCNMQVKDDEYAVQLTTKDGKNYKFDDLGCMHKWKEQNGADNISAEYVRDNNNKEWIESDKATYVYDASFRTPMAYGIVNFKDKASAEAYVAKQGVGQMMSAQDLANHEWKQNKDMKHMMGESEHMDDKAMEEMHQESDKAEDSSHK